MTPQQIIFLSIVGIALVALIFLSESQKRYNLDSIKRKTVGDGQYGTARWATQEEIQSSTIQVPYEPEVWRYNEESRPTTTGIVVNLTQNKKQILATIDPSDSHTLMVAGTGGGKTTTFMIPNIEYALACGTSFISTDSKGDLLRLYGKLCEQYGYTCLNINFRTPMKSDSYNYIQTLLKYATTSLEPEQESKLIEEITSAINHIKMENEQIAHHRQELEKAMRDIEQHDLEVAQKQELKEIQGHHFGGLSR